VYDYWGLISLLHPLSLRKVSGPSADPLLSASFDGLLIIFQFCNVV
jgi:hypothetical protein